MTSHTPPGTDPLTGEPNPAAPELREVTLPRRMAALENRVARIEDALALTGASVVATPLPTTPVPVTIEPLVTTKRESDGYSPSEPRRAERAVPVPPP
jgi:hypothetical protein